MKRTLIVVSAMCLAVPVAAADWPQWRGADGTGVSTETNLPVRWSETENLRWKVDLPGRGLSGPVVAGGRVYLTACTGPTQDRLHVLAFDPATGRKQWERQLWSTGLTACHPKTSMAAPTPATDGERVYALFATCDLACFDRDGTLVWYRSLQSDYPNITNQVGMAASPVLWKDTLIVSLETDAEACALGIDKFTGVNRWRIDRTGGINWVTPLVRRIGPDAELLLQSRTNISAYNPDTGALVWSHRDDTLDTIPSPIAGGSSVFVPAGNLMALRPVADRGSPEVLWRSNKLKAATASPLLYQDKLYAVNSAGVVTCADPRDGSVLWQERVKGPFSASPIAGDGKLYLVNEEGLTTVLDTAAEKRVLAANPLGEVILASPAVADGAVFLRSDKHLFCVGGGK